MISVSVAMAAYNGERHIKSQLDSLAAQSHLPAELVITDDCSTDNTVEIIRAFARTAPFPVDVHRNEKRLGYRANFMRAANLCRSELIAFCDQDDYWYPIKIATSVAPFKDPDVLLSYHNADVVTEDGRWIASLATRAPLISTAIWFHPLGFTEVFRRTLLQLAGLWPNSQDSFHDAEPSAHDQWFFFLANVFGRTAYLDQPLAAYVQHGSNAFGWAQMKREGVKYRLRNRATEFSQYSKVAENRAAILGNAKNQLDENWQELAAAAAEHYHKVSWLYAERSNIYAFENLRDRFRAFCLVFGKAGYTGAWGLRYRDLLTDIGLGVPIGPLLPRQTPIPKSE